MINYELVPSLFDQRVSRGGRKKSKTKQDKQKKKYIFFQREDFKRKKNSEFKLNKQAKYVEKYALDCPGAAGRRDDEKAGHVLHH